MSDATTFLDLTVLKWSSSIAMPAKSGILKHNGLQQKNLTFTIDVIWLSLLPPSLHYCITWGLLQFLPNVMILIKNHYG